MWRLGVTMRKGVAALVGMICAMICAVTPSAAHAEPEENQNPGDPASSKEGPPRPPPLGAGDPGAAPPWRRSVDLGIDVAFIARQASPIADDLPTPVRYDAAVGYGFHGRLDLFRFLRFGAYFVSAVHTLELPPGSLGMRSEGLELDSVWAYSFGARLMPTYRFSDRLRSWVSLGAGWGRLEFDRMYVKEAGGRFEVRERSASFVEIPLGLGVSYDILPRWLALEIEVTGAFVVGQQGSSVQPAQAIDTAGKVRSIGSFPRLDGSFMHTIGLSILL